jgi:esterase
MPEQVANGVRLHYEQRGEGGSILCIHGAGSSALVWAEAVEKLAGIGRVIAYDRRGCARSDCGASVTSSVRAAERQAGC